MPGRTFRNYLSHLKKACFLAELSLERCTPAVVGVSRGLKAAQNKAFTFPNFLFTADLFIIINDFGWHDEFAQLCFISFLFSLRIPSEALVMRHAHPEGRISEFVAQQDKVLIGVRKFQSLDALIVKMNQRKNISGGCILKRPCLCFDGNYEDREI